MISYIVVVILWNFEAYFFRGRLGHQLATTKRRLNLDLTLTKV